MGKKSRRKGGKKKADRTEQQPQGQGQQQPAGQQPGRAVQNLQRAPSREYYVGDRVWIVRADDHENNNPNTYRGVIHEITEDHYLVTTVQAMIDGIETPIRVTKEDIFPDFHNFTLRFNVGDPVVALDNNDNWVAGKVERLWPVSLFATHNFPSSPEAAMMYYIIKNDEFNKSWPTVLDADVCIKSRPTSFRFKMGEHIVFDPTKAQASGNAAVLLQRCSTWISGVVTATDISIEGEDYSVYGCSFHLGKKSYSCRINQDDDAHIAQVDAEPRVRLFDAIEQGCKRDHFQYLAAHFNISVATFRDLVIAKAIEFASYQALLWLQHDCDVDVLRVKDEGGNNLLHMIAQSKHAARFIREVSKMNDSFGDHPDSCRDDFKEILHLNMYANDLMRGLNKKGEVWSHSLTRRGDAEAIDSAFSPQYRLAWDLMSLKADMVQSLGALVDESKDPLLKRIMDSFVLAATLHGQYEALRYVDDDDPRLDVFKGENAEYNAKIFSRFYLDWNHRLYQSGGVSFSRVKFLATSGHFEIFRLLYEAEPRLFNRPIAGRLNEDRNQYIHPQLPGIVKGNVVVGVDVVYTCVLGSNHSGDLNKRDLQKYLNDVKSYFLRGDEEDSPSLQSYLRNFCKARGERSFSTLRVSFGHYFERLSLITDEKNVEGRQKILEYLLLKRPNTHLDVLIAMKNRQSWVLRMMVNKGYLNLESQASANEFLLRKAHDFTFLEKGHIPSSMTTKCCLCFAAVQYDDLQSLQFLCEFGTPVEVVSGWNLLHFSAYMGRIEVVGWLSTQAQTTWNSFVSQFCSRKPFQGALATHIAISRGHLHLCELLMQLEGKKQGLYSHIYFQLELDTYEDENGKTLEYYARYSEHDFIRELISAAEMKKNKQLDLERNITTLFNIIDNEPIDQEQVKNFITSSKCLDWSGIWMGFCSRSDEKITMGLSFEDVIRKCCKKVNNELANWLCLRVFSEALNWGFYVGAPNLRENRVVPTDEIQSLFQDRGLEDLLILLQKKWFKNVSAECSLMYFHILDAALGGGERLEEVRTLYVLDRAVFEIDRISRSTIIDIFSKGGNEDEIRELMSAHSSIEKYLDAAACNREDSWQSIDMELNFLDCSHISYEDDHSLTKQLRYQYYSVYCLHQLNIVLATEGYAKLMQFCLNNLGGWTVKMELDAVRIASYFGHTEIVDMFFCPESSTSFLSNVGDRRSAAILGAGGSLRYSDTVAHVKKMTEIHTNPVKMKVFGSYEESAESLLFVVLNRYAMERMDHGSKTGMKMLRFITDNFDCTHDEMLSPMQYLQRRIPKGFGREQIFEWIVCIVELMNDVIFAFGIQPTTERMVEICKELAYWSDGVYEQCDSNLDGSTKILRWFQKAADLGIDLRPFREDMRMHRETDFGKRFVELEQKQLRQWSQFDVVKHGGTLAEVQEAVDSGNLILSIRDRGGYHLIHVSATCDRVDLLEWLVVAKCVDLNLLDGERRTASDVAKASKATDAMQWIVEWNAKCIILSFLRRNLYRAIRMRRCQKLDSAATLIQKIIRAHATRKIFSGVLLRRLEDSQRFLPVWGTFIESYYVCSQTLSSWAGIREKFIDIKVGLDDELLHATNERLSSAMDNVVQQDDEVDGIISAGINCDEMILVDDDAKETSRASHIDQWLSFQLTSHVVKFLQRGDKKYRSFFVRRMQQLARGERSRILQKALKGSKTLIYETYLEQKSGHRILWTEEGGTIVIWYIAKHKQVSRLMQLIDDSKSRSARQHMPDSLLSELQNEGLLPAQNEPKEVLLDIFGNVPLKIYDVSFNTIDEITKESWAPKLHLTDEERVIVEAEGTVLVLGRSGTGKTVVICNRIEYDRQSRAGRDPMFTQLFVARSARLCRYVEGAVSEDNRASFCTYGRLLSDVESSLPVGHHRSFNPSLKIDFRRFKQEIYTTNSTSNVSISELTLWTVIQTFLKGSIQAFQSPDGILSREEFVEVERLGKNRCRIPVELREQVYDEFLRYESYLKDYKLWDDCDRVRHLLLRIKESKEVDPDAIGQVQRSKVYVDEVQDYTQLELLLFFHLAGPNGLFLAGDPAQSVVEGTDFRFEEVRSVGHFVGSAIQKPKTVNVNFRSHSGILNCAGGVLDLMFTHFPSSAKQLKKDEGLFQGSRPGVLLGTSVDQLNILLSDKLKGAVVLTHDESARHWRRMLNEYKLVYGIRDAKGLEFKTVIILDFFREIPSSLQKPWRELVLDRVTQDNLEQSHPLIGTWLKLLYTGVTRCIEQLFFVETKSSTAGDASMRWLTQKDSHNEATLATRNNINAVEAMSMTSDEFVSEGIGNAELAEAVETELDQSQMLLERAIWCFEQTDNNDLAAKARMHYSSILFRLELQPPNDERDANDCALLETRAAHLMESLVKEGLIFEVLNLFVAVEPFLSIYAKEELERRVIRKLREIER